MQQPKDPILLMSVVNTLLRDQYSSLEALCEDREWNEKEIKEALKSVGYEYLPEQNQFR